MAQITSKPTSILVKIQPPRPAWLINVPLMTWKRVTGTAVTAVGANQGVGAWSGSVWDPIRQQVVLNGGGHGDSSDNGVYAIKLGVDVPAPILLKQKSSSVKADISYNTDGTPSARHTYWHLQYIPSLDGMFQMGGAAMYGSGNYNDGCVNGFNLKTNTWSTAGTYTSRPANMSSGAGDGVCQDGAGNVYVWRPESYGLLKWVPSPPGTWSFFTGISGGQWDRPIAFDSKRNRIMCFAYDGGRAVALDGKSITITWTGPNKDQPLKQSRYWEYCPERDSFIGVGSGGTIVYEINAETLVVNTLPIAGTPPTPGGGGYGAYYNRWRIVPELGIFYLVPDITSDLYVFRYKP